MTLEMGRAMACLLRNLPDYRERYETKRRKKLLYRGRRDSSDPLRRPDPGHVSSELQVLGETNGHRQAEDGEDPAKEWCVCGALCTVNDILVQKIKLRNLKEGKYPAFEKPGRPML